MKSKGKDLQDYIDPENGFLYRLAHHMIIDKKEIDRLEKITPYQSLNEKLIIAIENKIKTHSKQVIKALGEDEQDHIAKFIVSAGCKTDSDERLLPRELRKVIDDNMFCLEKLIDTEKREWLMTLVGSNCIRARHRDRVMNFKPDEEKAYQLLIIIQRRRYKDFFNFIKCQKKNIVKILDQGGVTEIKIQIREEHSEKKQIVAELKRKLRGHVDEDEESDLDEDEKEIVIEFLAELAENGICFTGISASNSDLTMFFQGEKEEPFPSLNDCESGSLKDTLEKLIRSLLKIPGSLPPLIKSVATGKHSDNHHSTTETEQNAGIYSN